MWTGAKTWGSGAGLGFCAEQRQEDLRGVEGGRSGLWWLQSRLVFAAVVVVVSVIGGVQGADAAECSNEALRFAQSAAFLPDCRAFEVVSPPEGEPNLKVGSHNAIGAQASSAGGGISWFSYYPLSGSLGGEFYNLSTRGPDGWSTEPVGPRLSPTNSGAFVCEPAMFFSADLSESVLVDGHEGGCPENAPVLVPGEPKGSQNLFVRDSATGAYALVDITPEGVEPSSAWLQDASDDFSHVVFEEEARLTGSAPAGASLYEWVAGAVSLVSVLPDGTPTVGVSPGAVTGGGNLAGTDAITHVEAADGTRVVFEAGGKLFLRENVEQALESARGPEGECLESAKACTVQIDASQAGGSGGGGGFVAANTTGTRIFFTDDAKAKLTVGTLAGSGQHLYEYETQDTPTGAQTGVLRDLTPAGELGLAGLSGISDDGSYLYVVAQAALTAEAVAGQPNLYVFHEGTPRFIATLGTEEEDSRDWRPYQLTARVSPSGRYIAFNSVKSLTGYDNTPARPNDCHVELGALGPCQEIFLYDAVQNELHCVSCTPGGAPPMAPAEIPIAARATTGWGPVYVRRNVLDDGRVFFDTANPILSGAGNGVSNVYEYDGGHLSLISTGASEANSFFYDASLSGNDLFFVTTQNLVQSDTGNGMRLYDARVDGGFPEPGGPAQCSDEGCRTAAAGVSAMPPLLTTNSQSTGNLLPQKHTVAVLARRQKLERALHACQRKKEARKRAACKRHAHLRYGVRSSRAKRGGGK
jgi:hypothetical protein